MKILIADDERLVRVSLISMLSELYPGEHEIDSVKNGEEMMEMVRANYYDVVFLDINMPKKNGLDALESCRQDSVETIWCVLTGYTEFQFAKRSISLGVREYLLKPLDIEELRHFMDGIIDEKREKRNNRHQLFVNRMSQAFTYADTTGIMKQMLPVKDDAEYSIYLFLLDTDSNDQRQNMYAKLYEGLNGYLDNIIEKTDQYALFFLQSGELCLLIEGKEYDRVNSFLQLHGGENRLGTKIIAMRSKAKNFQEVYMNKQFLLALSPLRILEKNLMIISLEEICSQEMIMEKRYFCEKIEMLTACYLTENFEGANKVLLEMQTDERLKECFGKVEKQPLLSHLSIVWRNKFECGSYADFIKQFRNVVQNGIRESYGRKNDLIQQIKDYVEDNYMEDVTIATIGSQFGITPSYISRIFKDKTGKKYIDYVTGIRMKNAKKLLLNEPQLSVREVAERVGYVSEKHFSKTFKKYFQCIPSQVRD